MLVWSLVLHGRYPLINDSNWLYEQFVNDNEGEWEIPIVEEQSLKIVTPNCTNTRSKTTTRP